jgi:peptide deformylase
LRFAGAGVLARARNRESNSLADPAILGRREKNIMPLDILQTGHLVLRQAARALTPEEIGSRGIRDLIANMRETMREAPGVGLAAPQIGLPLQLAVIEDRKEYHKELSAEQLVLRERGSVPFHVIINPAISEVKDRTVELYEGCLSMAGFLAVVPRARSVRVECLDEKGKPRVIEATGWYARILQHEIDHLRGTLYLDHMRTRTLTTMDNWNQFWKGKPIEEVRSALQF